MINQLPNAIIQEFQDLEKQPQQCTQPKTWGKRCKQHGTQLAKSIFILLALALIAVIGFAGRGFLSSLFGKNTTKTKTKTKNDIDEKTALATQVEEYFQPSFSHHEVDVAEGQSITVTPNMLSMVDRENFVLEKALTDGDNSAGHAVIKLPNDLLAIAQDDGTISIWNTQINKLSKLLRGHNAPVLTITEIKYPTIASGDQAGTIRLWDLTTGQCTNIFQDYRGRVNTISLLDNKVVAIGGDKNDICIWYTNEDSCRLRLTGHNDTILALTRLNLTEPLLASGSADNTIGIFNWQTGEKLKALPWHSADVTALLAGPNGMLISGSLDKTICVGNVTTGICEQQLTGHHNTVTALAMLPDGGGKLISGSDDNTSKLWDIDKQSGKWFFRKTFHGHKGSITGVAVLSEETFASTSWDKFVFMWDIYCESCTDFLYKSSSTTTSLATITEANNELIISGDRNNVLHFWDKNSGSCIGSILQNSEDIISSVKTINSNQIASASQGGQVNVIDLIAKNITKTFAIPDSILTMNVLSPENLVLAGKGRTIWALNINTGTTLKFPAHTNNIFDTLCLSSTSIASCGSDGTIRILNTTTGNSTTFDLHAGAILTIASVGSDTIAYAGDNGIIGLLNTTTGTTYQRLFGHNASIRTLLDLSNGRLASGDMNGVILIHDIQHGGTITKQLNGKGNLALILLPNGHLAAAGDGGIVEIYKPTSTPAAEIFIEFTDKKNIETESGGHSVTSVTQDQINRGYFQLTHNGSPFPPTCKITIKIGNTTYPPEVLNFNFFNTTIVALVSAGGGVVFIGSIVGLSCWINSCCRKYQKANLDKETNTELAKIEKDGFIMKSSDLVLGSKLGEGATASVFRGQWRRLLIAVKIFNVAEQQNGLDGSPPPCMNEIKILAKIRHPNIVSFYGACPNIVQYNNKLGLVMELMPHGTLNKYLQTHPNFDWTICIKLALDIAKGLFFLHSQTPPILHRDLKSENVLLDENNRAKLSDFGLAGATIEYAGGTIQYTAPEVLLAAYYRSLYPTGTIPPTVAEAIYGSPAPSSTLTVNTPQNGKQTTASDIYSFGMLLWEIVTHQRPYNNIDDKYKIPLVKTIIEGPPLKISETTPLGIAELIQHCWNKRRKERLTASEVLDRLEQLSGLPSSNTSVSASADPSVDTHPRAATPTLIGLTVHSGLLTAPLSLPDRVNNPSASHERIPLRAESLNSNDYHSIPR